jgi:hypothetical protein
MPKARKKVSFDQSASVMDGLGEEMNALDVGAERSGGDEIQTSSGGEGGSGGSESIIENTSEEGTEDAKMATDDDIEKSVVVGNHFVQTMTKTAANLVNNDQVSKIVPKL